MQAPGGGAGRVAVASDTAAVDLELISAMKKVAWCLEQSSSQGDEDEEEGERRRVCT
jgi:hypothetical protein